MPPETPGQIGEGDNQTRQRLETAIPDVEPGPEGVVALPVAGHENDSCADYADQQGIEQEVADIDLSAAAHPGAHDQRDDKSEDEQKQTQAHAQGTHCDTTVEWVHDQPSLESLTLCLACS